MDTSANPVSRQMKTSAQFVRDFLHEAGHADQHVWIDQRNLNDDVVAAIVGMATSEGGVVDDHGVDRTVTMNNLGALVGRSGWHIRIPAAGWALVMGGVPLAIAIVRATLTVDPTAPFQIGATVLALANGLAGTMQRLSKEDVALYLAVKAAEKTSAGATATSVGEILAAAQAQGTAVEGVNAIDVKQRLDALVGKKAIREEQGRYTAK